MLQANPTQPNPTQLLKDMADAAGGASCFGFVPDGTMNATVHNCAIANLAVAAAADLRLTLALPASADGSPPPPPRLVGGYGAKADAAAAPEGGSAVSATPGQLQYGQPRTFLVELPPGFSAAQLRVSLSYRLPGRPALERLAAAAPGGTREDPAGVAAARQRLDGVEAILKALRMGRMDLGQVRVGLSHCPAVRQSVCSLSFAPAVYAAQPAALAPAPRCRARSEPPSPQPCPPHPAQARDLVKAAVGKILAEGGEEPPVLLDLMGEAGYPPSVRPVRRIRRHPQAWRSGSRPRPPCPRVRCPPR